jgi:hypothetical protein
VRTPIEPPFPGGIPFQTAFPDAAKRTSQQKLKKADPEGPAFPLRPAIGSRPLLFPLDYLLSETLAPWMRGF